VAEPVELRPVSETGRTGFKSLIHDTAFDFKHFVSDKEPLLWLAGGGAAALALHPLDDNVNDRFKADGAIHSAFKPGQIIGYGAVQIGAAVGTWAIGRKIDPQGRAAHIGLDLLRAQIVTQAFTYGLKYAVHRQRPDGTGYSFPSGHASTTFATASVLERHFGWRAGIPTYAIATYVAASRLHENRHYLSDVIFGGALGLAAGRTVTRHGRHSFAMVPMVVPGRGVGIMFVKLG
jgi:membrane-associated phospholipid phosphatase